MFHTYDIIRPNAWGAKRETLPGLFGYFWREIRKDVHSKDIIRRKKYASTFLA